MRRSIRPKGATLEGLPPHFRIIRDRPDPRPDVVRQEDPAEASLAEEPRIPMAPDLLNPIGV
jgi:hypothetical protein